MPRSALPIVVALALLVAACGRGASASPDPAAATTPAPSVAAATPGATVAPEATATTGPEPTAEPTEEPEATATTGPEPTAEPTGEPEATPSPTDEPVTTEAPAETGSPAPAGTGAEACSGTAENRAFFEGIARAVDWPVLCAVLPKGWFVAQGSYRLANGGKLLIGYKGPAGATLSLSEGAWCTSPAACVPAGTDEGVVALGPLEGTLVRTGTGYAVIAAPGENPSWQLATTGLDGAATTALAAALAEVDR